MFAAELTVFAWVPSRSNFNRFNRHFVVFFQRIRVLRSPLSRRGRFLLRSTRLHQRRQSLRVFFFSSFFFFFSFLFLSVTFTIIIILSLIVFHLLLLRFPLLLFFFFFVPLEHFPRIPPARRRRRSRRLTAPFTNPHSKI